MSSESDLKEFFLNNDGNVLHKWHHYFENYDWIFNWYLKHVSILRIPFI